MLKSVDVLFLRYRIARYLYNWIAVYFNALALYKPVLATPVLNPEILAHYQVGREVDLTDLQHLREQLGQFLQSYETMLPTYERDLHRVNDDFSTAVFLQNVQK